jgi:hypothetical protein
MSGSLYSHGQSSLVPGAITGDASGHDFTPVSYELAQQSLVFVVDLVYSVFAETTGFLFSSLELNHIDVILRFLFPFISNAFFACLKSSRRNRLRITTGHPGDNQTILLSYNFSPTSSPSVHCACSRIYLPSVRLGPGLSLFTVELFGKLGL